jgi:L-threonylcarbamoyladenylate synthase
MAEAACAQGLSDQDVAVGVECLRSGGTLAVATESFFALVVDAKNPHALDQLFALKGRDAARGVALMVPSTEQWRGLVRAVSPLSESLAEAFWPGPLTIVLPCADGLDERVQHAGTVGVRVPGPCPAAQVVRAFGSAVTATSANLAGEPPCARAAEVREQLAGALRPLPLILGDSAPGGRVSTLVRVDGRDWQVLRAGAIGEAALARIAESLR